MSLSWRDALSLVGVVRVMRKRINSPWGREHMTRAEREGVRAACRRHLACIRRHLLVTGGRLPEDAPADARAPLATPEAPDAAGGQP